LIDALVLTAIAVATALATGVGALPVALLGVRAAAIKPLLSGLASGVMAVAAVQGLLVPAFDEGRAVVVVAAAIAGAAALLASRAVLQRRAAVAGILSTEQGRRSALVFGVLLAHSLPEGLAIGSAYASPRSGLSAFVIAAIAIQNVPEGTATAIPMRAAGYGPGAQVWAAVLTSAPQVPGALLAWIAVEQIGGLLPAAFALAAGAMLMLVAADLLPDAWASGPRRWVVTGSVLGAAAMAGIAAALQIQV
jgi:ZIP family zinc transporter